MVKSFKAIGFVNTFLLVINSQEPRFSQQLIEAISLFSEIFGQEFFESILLCYTKFSYDQKSVRQRQRGAQRDEQTIISEVTQKFIDEFEYSLKSDQFIFLDNAIFFDNQEEYEELEIRKFMQAKQKIIEFTQARPPFLCLDIKEAVKEADRLKQELLLKERNFELEKQRLIQEQQDLLASERLVAQLAREEIEDEMRREVEKVRAASTKEKEQAIRMQKDLEEERKTFEELKQQTLENNRVL